MSPALLDTFAACHLLAFGTDWGMGDYLSEAKRRLVREESAEWAPIVSPDDAAAARHHLEEGDDYNSARLYMAALGLHREMKAAANILVEAASRAQVYVLGFRGGASEIQPIPPLRFVSMGSPLSYTQGRIFKRDTEEVDWDGLRWSRDQVADVASADWHDLRPDAKTPTAANDYAVSNRNTAPSKWSCEPETGDVTTNRLRSRGGLKGETTGGVPAAPICISMKQPRGAIVNFLRDASNTEVAERTLKKAGITVTDENVFAELYRMMDASGLNVARASVGPTVRRIRLETSRTR